MRSSLSAIQQAFVHRYMDQDDVLGVRIRKIDDELVIFVDVENRQAVQLPETFCDLPVRVRESRRAVLAYS